jgi:para-aminobenzoate synthetase / 4-amino-4-deoxychorismate lyase
VIDLGWLARLRCRVVSEPLGAALPPPPRAVRSSAGAPPSALAGGPPSPEQVLRAASGSDGLLALIGQWADGGAVLASDPLYVLPPAADPIAALGVQPTLTGAEPDVVGGGWFGWLGYDSGCRLAFYDHLLRYRAGRWFFEALWSAERDGLLSARREELTALLDLDAPARWTVGDFGGAGRTEHLCAVERAIELIRAGQIYQVNVCTRLAATFTGSPVGLFADGVAALRPAFGGYLDGGDRTLASFSPELFLRRRGRDVITSPIKGTWPRRDPDAAGDADGGADDGAAALRASAKDAAENVMIVDLMRNDLGRVCETGSVRATALLEVQPHPGVWHLVSTVSGRLRAGVGDDALLRATFPPGSVTGTPKQRAVRAIAELEARPRGAYTGAIGFASPSWGAEFSVAIRTFEISGGPGSPGRSGRGRPGKIELGVGGGVTADSVPMLEWRECLHKAAPLLGALGAALDPGSRTAERQPTRAQLAGGLLETVLAVDGSPLRLADHLARLDRSSRELYRTPIPADLPERVRRAVQALAGRSAVRIVLRPGAATAVRAAPIGERPRACLAHLVRGRAGLWRHKWADREYLSGQQRDGSVPIFVAANGTVLETGRGNVFLLAADGTLVTAPLDDDLLPGITRRALLDLARDQGRRTVLRPITTADLYQTAAFWTSSLSLAVAIHAVDGIALPEQDDLVAEFAGALGRLAV